MTLTDTHCHLDFEQFDDDRDAVLQRARAAGVQRILIPAVNLKSSMSAALLAQSHPALFAAIGVHPNDVNLWDAATIPALTELTSAEGLPGESADADQNSSQADDRRSKVVAIGEIGLDYYWETAPRQQQKSVLERQLEFAAAIQKPVIIHMREKDDALGGPCSEDLMKILETWAGALRREQSSLAERPGVLHSFSGSAETAGQALHLGFWIGVTGPVTFEKADARREVVAGVPLDRLLIETDAPFLAPAPKRGARNEPAFVRYIADKIGDIHSKNPEEVAAVTSANAARLFAWGD